MSEFRFDSKSNKVENEKLIKNAITNAALKNIESIFTSNSKSFNFKSDQRALDRSNTPTKSTNFEKSTINNKYDILNSDSR